MAKMTKAQKKRMVQEIRKKSQKLYTQSWLPGVTTGAVVSTKDMEAIERMCARWMKRIG